MDGEFRDGDVVELLWELTVQTDQGNVYIYPAGTRLIYLRPGAQPETSDLHDGDGNVFPNVSHAVFQKV